MFPSREPDHMRAKYTELSERHGIPKISKQASRVNIVPAESLGSIWYPGSRVAGVESRPQGVESRPQELSRNHRDRTHGVKAARPRRRIAGPSPPKAPRPRPRQGEWQRRGGSSDGRVASGASARRQSRSARLQPHGSSVGVVMPSLPGRMEAGGRRDVPVRARERARRVQALDLDA